MWRAHTSSMSGAASPMPPLGRRSMRTRSFRCSPSPRRSRPSRCTSIQEDICQPLGIDSLWVGIPDAVAPRVATLINMPPIPPGAPGMAPGALSPLAIPPQVGTTQEVFGRADVRRACLPGAGGIMNARSAARFFAMLAQGGALDGVRLLSAERVRWFSVPRPPSAYDYVQGVPQNGSIGGFHLVASIGDAAPPCQLSRRGGGPRPFVPPAPVGPSWWGALPHRTTA